MAVTINTHAMMRTERPVALEDAASRFADLDPVEAEATIDAFVAGAIAAWRLEDATYWQRVKFRARMIRTMRRNAGTAPPVEAKSLPETVRTNGVNDETA